MPTITGKAISELAALPGTGIADGDLFPIVDISVADPTLRNKSVTASEARSYFTGVSAPLTHASRHLKGAADAIKLDDLAEPDDNTDLNVSTTAHGLCPKLPNDPVKFLDGQGNYSEPNTVYVGGGAGSVTRLAISGAAKTLAKGLVLFNSGYAIDDETILTTGLSTGQMLMQWNSPDNKIWFMTKSHDGTMRYATLQLLDTVNEL